MPRINDREWRKARKEIAKERNALNGRRTPKEQLDALDARLGAGKGASRERARLNTLMGGQK